jgi:signal transduction histidine kinase
MTGERSDAWSPDVFHDAISLIAEGVTEVVGFEVCAISVVREDGYLEMVAVAGSEDAREQLLGHRTPVSEIQAEIDNADHWGKLCFVPHERMGIDQSDLGWVPDLEVSDDPDAWHPLDLLLAPFYGDDGQMRGLMSIDVPLDGRRPGPAKREQLQRYAVQAGRAVLTAHDRANLSDQLRLAATARQVVRQASSGTDFEAIFEVVHPALMHGFSASGMWIQTFGRDGDRDDEGTAGVFTSTGTRMHLPGHLVPLAEASARALWAAQRVVVLSPDHDLDTLLDRRQQEDILEFLDGLGVHSVLFIPLGAGKECLGNLVLTRTAGDRPWSDTERESALEIGHDLGRTLSNVRSLAREREVNDELRRLDVYKSEMIATVAHELKNPLTAILGHLEILDSVPDLLPAVRTSLTAMERGSTRMSQLIEDLLTLSRVGDPDLVMAREPVDLGDVLNEVVDLVKMPAERKEITLELVPPAAPVVALGDAAELDRVMANLVSNAIKYSPDGRTVTLSLERADDEVVFTCRDEGLGISDEDQRHLFTEFFRSTNPVAAAEPGTGLGLTIVQRIVAHHGGRVDVASELGRGSTFTVRLPAAA